MADVELCKICELPMIYSRTTTCCDRDGCKQGKLKARAKLCDRYEKALERIAHSDTRKTFAVDIVGIAKEELQSKNKALSEKLAEQQETGTFLGYSAKQIREMDVWFRQQNLSWQILDEKYKQGFIAGTKALEKELAAVKQQWAEALADRRGLADAETKQVIEFFEPKIKLLKQQLAEQDKWIEEAVMSIYDIRTYGNPEKMWKLLKTRPAPLAESQSLRETKAGEQGEQREGKE